MDISSKPINWQNFAVSLQTLKKDPENDDDAIVISSDSDSTEENSSRNTNPESPKQQNSTPSSLPTLPSVANSTSTLAANNGPGSSIPSAVTFQAVPIASLNPVLSTSTSIQTSTFQVALQAADIRNIVVPATQLAHMQQCAQLTVPGYVVNGVYYQNTAGINQPLTIPTSASTLTVPGKEINLSQNSSKHRVKNGAVKQLKPPKRPRRPRNNRVRNVATVQPTSTQNIGLQTPLEVLEGMSDLRQPLLTTTASTPQSEIISTATSEASSCHVKSSPSSGIWQYSDNCVQCIAFAKKVTPLLKRLKLIEARPNDSDNVFEVKRILAEMDNQAFVTLMFQLLETFPEKIISQIAALEPI